MTATTDPASPGGPEPAWFPEVGPTQLDRLRAWRPWAPPALVGAIIGLGTAYTAWQDPNEGGVFPACPLRAMTGLDCPGCGGTRAVHALTHGDVGAAFDHNALLTIVLPLLLVAWGVWMVHALLTTRARARDGGIPPWPSWLRVPQLRQRGWFAVIALVVAFAVLRNVSAVPVLDFFASEA